MINKFFPLKLHLHIFQLEGYNSSRFLKWISKNYLTRSLEKKKPLVWTQKAKFLFIISISTMTLLLVLSFVLFSFLGLLVALILVTQTYLFLLISLLILKPYEYLNKLRVKKLTISKIQKLKKEGLIVIGITGSFGKTTTKEFLYELLKTKYKVLKTPASYNTLFGIYKVVDLELSNYFEIFICEMGAYHQGEIAELCDLVMPDHGILTGINEQHLERFGCIENTIKAKFELIQFIPSEGYKIINFDNENVRNNYVKYTKEPILYGENSQTNYYKNLRYINGKLCVDFYIDSIKLELKDISIYGRGNVSNLLASAVFASRLGVSLGMLEKSIKCIKPVEHRLEVKEFSDKTIIDDAYSSNIEGFKVALELLQSYISRPKVLVTPGIVELGNKTIEIHQNLGKEIDKVCDFAFLVGNSVMVDSLRSSIKKTKVINLKSINDLNSKLTELSLSNPVILIENDLPENY